MKLEYTAYDGSGKGVTGTLECPDAAAAADILRGRGLYVANVGQAQAEPAAGTGRRRRGGPKAMGRRKTLKHVAILSRQLCVLTSSGTPLVDALSALERQTPPGRWHEEMAALRERVEQGKALSEAMAAAPEVFDAVACSLVTAGESSGHLPDMLDRLSQLKRRQLSVLNAITGAMIYPCLLVTVATAIFLMLLIFIVPRFAMLFSSLDVPLPPTTRVLVQASGLFRHYWPVVLIVVAGLVTGVIVGLRSPAGQRFKDTFVLKVPYMGQIVKGFATARIVRLLGVLLSGHVPLLNALVLIRGAVANVHYDALIAKAHDHVARGEPLSQAFSDPFLVTPSVHEAIRSGEQSGQLDRLLLEIAGFLDEENEVIVRSLTSIMEPVILVVMGLLVGAVALSMFLPLFDLTAMTQGGRA
jgi:type II secretory pathway component PulF